MSSRRVTRAEGLNDRQIRAAVVLIVVILGLILLMWVSRVKNLTQVGVFELGC